MIFIPVEIDHLYLVVVKVHNMMYIMILTESLCKFCNSYEILRKCKYDCKRSHSSQ